MGALPQRPGGLGAAAGEHRPLGALWRGHEGVGREGVDLLEVDHLHARLADPPATAFTDVSGAEAGCCGCGAYTLGRSCAMRRAIRAAGTPSCPARGR